MNLYQKCNSNCLICIEKEKKEHCLQCDNDNNYYIVRNSIQECKLHDMIIQRFYFNETEKAFIQCANAWLVSETNSVICVDICPEGYFMNKENNYICTQNCNIKNPYMLNTTRECVFKCPKAMSKIENRYCTPYIDITQEENDILIDIPKEDIFQYIDVTTFSEEGKNIIGKDYVVQIFPMDSPMDYKKQHIIN